MFVPTTISMLVQVSSRTMKYSLRNNFLFSNCHRDDLFDDLAAQKSQTLCQNNYNKILEFIVADSVTRRLYGSVNFGRLQHGKLFTQ